MLHGYVASARRSHTIRFQYDQPLVARMILARILWLQGFPDQGLRLALENVEDAQAIGHALSVCGALEVACLVAIWSGDLAAADRSVAMLLDHSARHALAAWHARGRCLHGVLLIRRGEVGAGYEMLHAALDELRATGFVPYQTGLLGTLAQGLAGVGRIPEALATIDEALARSERDEEYWCIAELVRIKAELRPAGGRPGRGRRGRGAVPAGARVDAPARDPLDGAALRHRSRPAVASSRAAPARLASCWPRRTPGSPRASTPPSSGPRRRCSTVSASRPGRARAGRARRWPAGPEGIAGRGARVT